MYQIRFVILKSTFITKDADQGDNILQEAQVPIVNNDLCESWNELPVTDTMVCAG